ncbi:MAG: fasciclin domain-containing protein [Phycisphaerae bacterium]
MLGRKFITGMGIAAALTLGVTAVSFAQDKPKEDKPAAKPEEKKGGEAKGTEAKADKDIVETAMANKDFSTLCDLLKAADLVDTLKGPGPFTVFAPTNAAFEKIGKDKLEALKKDKAKLASILKYHVASGNMMAADVTKAKTIKTVNGAELKVTVDGKTVKVDASTVTATDIKTKNGVIHVIDTVAMPEEKKPS